MSSGHQQQQLIQLANNHSANSNNINIINGNSNNNNISGRSVTHSKGSWSQRSKYDRKFPSQQSSQGSQQSIDLAVQSQEGPPADRPVGAVMGIFFKVWSLVKVSKGRNQRLRHQASDEAGQFEYIPAARMPQSGTSESLDLSARVPILKHRLQVLQYPQSGGSQTQTPGTNSTSSGVSSGSSVRTTSRKRVDSFTSRGPRNNSAEISGKQKASWASRIKRSATSINQAEFGCRPNRWKRMSSEQCSREPEEPPAFSELEQTRAPVAVDDEEDSNNDIYSTPNDSIPSVAGSMSERLSFFQPQHHYQQPHQQQQQTYSNNKPYQMTKSLSANNFSQLLTKTGTPQLPVSHFESIAESADSSSQVRLGEPRLREEPRQRRLGRLNQNGARFFISSSSSEDSNSAKAQTTAVVRQSSEIGSPAETQQRHLVSTGTLVNLNEGVHCHQPARPDSLGLALESAPMGAPPRTPLELSLLESGSILPGKQTHQQRTPGLKDYSNNWYHQSAHSRGCIPNSMSLFDCKISQQQQQTTGVMLDKCAWPAPSPVNKTLESDPEVGEFELTEMLLESGSNPEARDSKGRSVLMLAVLSDNLATLKCLLERRSVPIDATDANGYTALDLACNRKPSVARVEIVRLLVANGAHLDSVTSPRLIDRLIGEHRSFPASQHRLAYVECLLQAGAKIGSATWAAARGKLDVQLCMLTKLCQDGYYLYKECSLEAAVYRFEYALRRLAELEKELLVTRLATLRPLPPVARQLKYQIYLGLSRCERKRRFYKRALEFAHMSILVDSTAYEGFYSKALILKELGHTDDALLAVHQTSWLLERSIALTRSDLDELEHCQEASMLAKLSSRSPCIEQPANNHLLGYLHSNNGQSQRSELLGQLDYLEETRRFVSRLRGDIMDHKLRPGGDDSRSQTHGLLDDGHREQVEQQRERQCDTTTG